MVVILTLFRNLNKDSFQEFLSKTENQEKNQLRTNTLATALYYHGNTLDMLGVAATQNTTQNTLAIC